MGMEDFLEVDHSNVAMSTQVSSFGGEELGVGVRESGCSTRILACRTAGALRRAPAPTRWATVQSVFTKVPASDASVELPDHRQHVVALAACMLGRAGQIETFARFRFPHRQLTSVVMLATMLAFLTPAFAVESTAAIPNRVASSLQSPRYT